MMAAVELDPMFVKALKLMQSKSRDSADQLKQMLEDYIAQKKTKAVSIDIDKPPQTSNLKNSMKIEEEKRKEAEKRQLEKLKSQLSELSHPEAKRAKLESSSSASTKEEKNTIEPEKKDIKREIELDDKDNEDVRVATSDSEDTKNIDADDFAFDLGISCTMCRSFEVSPGNQLMECMDCHNLYHQECHKPQVTEQDVNDPRFVWYCSRCSKSLKKMVTKPPKAKVALSSTTTKEQDGSGKTPKSPTPTTNLFQFRRSESKSSSKETGNGAAAKPMSGFESLAANLSGRNLFESNSAKSKIDQLRQMSWSKSDATKANSSAAKTESSSAATAKSDSSSKLAPKSGQSVTKTNWTGSVAVAAMNAEKKLQMVKKRAAAATAAKYGSSEKKHYK